MKNNRLFTTFAAIAASMLTASVASVHGEGCERVFAEGVAQVGFIEVAPGIYTLGGLPTPVVIGGVSGLLSSITTSGRTTGANAQGAQHLTLRHKFVSTDPARPGSFTTEDRAVLAPAGTDPNIGNINDVLEIVSGTGVFANTDGFLKNTATINLKNMTLTYSVRGRVCGDGL